MSIVLEFLMAVGKHWLGWGAGGLLVSILAILDYRYSWKLSKRIHTAFLVLGLFVSMFLAWKDQRDLHINAEQQKNTINSEKEKLHGQIIEKDRRIEELRDSLASRPIEIPPSQIQIVRVPDASSALFLTDIQANAISDELRKFSGQSVEIFLQVPTSPNLDNFARTLTNVFQKAGLTANMTKGTIMGVVPSGVSMSIGEGRVDIADVVGGLLRNFGVSEGPIPARRDPERGSFQIRIAP